MHAEDVELTDLAAEVGTPFYCYSSATLRRHMRVIARPSRASKRCSPMR